MSRPRKRHRKLTGVKAQAAVQLFLCGHQPQAVARLLRSTTDRVHQALRANLR